MNPNPPAVPNLLTTPVRGVHLTGGVLQQVFADNVRYLLEAYPLDSILYRFRERAGNATPPGRVMGWERERLYGSLAGLFLMGSGNALRWNDNAALRAKLDAVVAGIDACKQPNGFIMAYREDEALNSPVTTENPNYVRSWVTHGLLDASLAGNPQALPLIRGHHDWLNQWEGLRTGVPSVKDRHTGYQGMPSISRLYFSPLGKPADIATLQDYWQEDWWLDQFLAGDDRAIYRRDDRMDWWTRENNFTGPFPHGYEITGFEAYLDLYRATGDVRYLHAMNSAWTMMRDKWQHVGGSIAMCEGHEFPPGSYSLGTGELCCAVFWVKLNQRYHLLYPDAEVFVGEIEKSLYNACIPNQWGSAGIAYHARLHGEKMGPQTEATCCEGQGTRLYGSLPEYLYSLAPDGLYVDLYAPSQITWTQDGAAVTLTCETRFPEAAAVVLRVALAEPQFFSLHLRLPEWAAAEVEIRVNGELCAHGKPGSYRRLSRCWRAGDEVAFALPLRFRATRLRGAEVIPGQPRYAIEVGPILLAAVGPLDGHGCVVIRHPPDDPAAWLQPVPGKPLHFSVFGQPDCEFLPYYEIRRQPFTCFPIVQASPVTSRL
jgi:DUF1680 family protein